MTDEEIHAVSREGGEVVVFVADGETEAGPERHVGAHVKRREDRVTMLQLASRHGRGSTKPIG